MKKIITYLAISLSIIVLSGCFSTGNDTSSTDRGLVPVHLTKNSDASASVSFDSSIENTLSKEIPLEIKGSAKWENVETTHYVLPELAKLIAQGVMKVVVSQQRDADGSFKNSVSFEMK